MINIGQGVMNNMGTIFLCFADRASQYILATDQLNAKILVS